MGVDTLPDHVSGGIEISYLETSAGIQVPEVEIPFLQEVFKVNHGRAGRLLSCLVIS
jgi:hypothetical protein